MADKPDYTPVHKKAQWLSSEDVKGMIFKVADAGGDKATCFDLLAEIERETLRIAMSAQAPSNEEALSRFGKR